LLGASNRAGADQLRSELRVELDATAEEQRTRFDQKCRAGQRFRFNERQLTPQDARPARATSYFVAKFARKLKRSRIVGAE
jgi:hypothetical protein